MLLKLHQLLLKNFVSCLLHILQLLPLPGTKAAIEATQCKAGSPDLGQPTQNPIQGIRIRCSCNCISRSNLCFVSFYIPGTWCNWGNSEAACCLRATLTRGNLEPNLMLTFDALKPRPNDLALLHMPVLPDRQGPIYAPTIAFINRDYHHHIPRWKYACCRCSKYIRNILVQCTM